MTAQLCILWSAYASHDKDDSNDENEERRRGAHRTGPTPRSYAKQHTPNVSRTCPGYVRGMSPMNLFDPKTLPNKLQGRIIKPPRLYNTHRATKPCLTKSGLVFADTTWATKPPAKIRARFGLVCMGNKTLPQKSGKNGGSPRGKTLGPPT